MWRGEQVEVEGRDRTCGEEGEGHLEVCVAAGREGGRTVLWMKMKSVVFVELAHPLP